LKNSDVKDSDFRVWDFLIVRPQISLIEEHSIIY